MNDFENNNQFNPDENCEDVNKSSQSENEVYEASSVNSEKKEENAYFPPENDTPDYDAMYNTFSDSYYLNNVSKETENTEPENTLEQGFIKPEKKKRYISVPAAIIALVLTAVISISGGAMLSNITPFKKTASGGEKSSVSDNIKSSNSIKGTTASLNTLTGEPLSTPEIVDKVGPAVVGIINKTTYNDAYGMFGSLYGNSNDEVEQSSGSGVVISSDGYIVTNNHVVENATKLTVILNTGKEYDGKVIGKDSTTDLAVIKVEASDLPYAQMGSSSSLRVGETSIAIGNPLGQEFAGTTTQGIISGLNRSVTIDNKTMNLIQTDAAINPGNSGGALVNEYGLLIGINTAKISSSTLEGLGFAIPIDEAKPVIQELMQNGYVTGRPVIGIAGRAVTKDDAAAYNLKIGVYVSSMTANGPAYMAGIKVGDIIVECEGEPIETVDDINKIKNKKSPGDKVEMKIYRKGNFVNVTVILGEEAPVNEN